VAMNNRARQQGGAGSSADQLPITMLNLLSQVHDDDDDDDARRRHITCV
jgi:hypothetical protein